MEMPDAYSEPRVKVPSLYMLASQTKWKRDLCSHIPVLLNAQIALGQVPKDQFYRAASTWAVALQMPTHKLVGPVPSVTRATDFPMDVPWGVMTNPRYPPENPDRFLQRLQPGLRELVIRSRSLDSEQIYPTNLTSIQKITLPMVSPDPALLVFIKY